VGEAAEGSLPRRPGDGRGKVGLGYQALARGRWSRPINGEGSQALALDRGEGCALAQIRLSPVLGKGSRPLPRFNKGLWSSPRSGEDLQALAATRPSSPTLDQGLATLADPPPLHHSPSWRRRGGNSPQPPPPFFLNIKIIIFKYFK